MTYYHRKNNTQQEFYRVSDDVEIPNILLIENESQYIGAVTTLSASEVAGLPDIVEIAETVYHDFRSRIGTHPPHWIPGH